MIIVSVIVLIAVEQAMHIAEKCTATLRTVIISRFMQIFIFLLWQEMSDWHTCEKIGSSSTTFYSKMIFIVHAHYHQGETLNVIPNFVYLYACSSVFEPFISYLWL